MRPWLVRAVVRFLADRPGPHILHGYSSWGCVALAACRRLSALDIEAKTVTTFYTTAEHEASAKLRGRAVRANFRSSSELALELAWVRALTTPLERGVYHESHTIVVNYRSVQALLELAYGGRDNIFVLPYAAPTAFGPRAASLRRGSARAGLPRELAGGDLPLIVCVARQDGRKGVDVLIRALAGLRDAGVPFRACLIGSGMLLGLHRRLVRSLGLESQVALPGRVPDVMPYLLACDVFVLPSTEEGSGSVAVLEALQAGAAIVSTGVDGIPEDLTHERDALLVAPGSVDELRNALRRVLDDESLRIRLGREARVLHERRFAPDVVARSLGVLYRSLGLSPART
jgi:glycosyltransferase involved in cell wall biosynthesis